MAKSGSPFFLIAFDLEEVVKKSNKDGGLFLVSIASGSTVSPRALTDLTAKQIALHDRLWGPSCRQTNLVEEMVLSLGPSAMTEGGTRALIVNGNVRNSEPVRPSDIRGDQASFCEI